MALLVQNLWYFFLYSYFFIWHFSYSFLLLYFSFCLFFTSLPPVANVVVILFSFFHSFELFFFSLSFFRAIFAHRHFFSPCFINFNAFPILLLSFGLFIRPFCRPFIPILFICSALCTCFCLFLWFISFSLPCLSCILIYYSFHTQIFAVFLSLIFYTASILFLFFLFLFALSLSLPFSSLFFWLL